MSRTTVAVTVLVLVGAGYTVVCGSWPFTDCRRCHGTGARRSRSGRDFRRCRPCGGTGVRLRTGRRGYDSLRIGCRQVGRTSQIMIPHRNRSPALDAGFGRGSR